MSGYLEPIPEDKSFRNSGPIPIRDLSKPLLSSRDSTVSDTDESDDDESDDDESDDDESDDDESEYTVESEARVDFAFLSMRFAAVCSLVVGGVMASAAAIATVQAVAVYVAGGVFVLNAPWVASKQYKMAKEVGKSSGFNVCIVLFSMPQSSLFYT